MTSTSNHKAVLRIGTRGSRLALAQAELVRGWLQEALPHLEYRVQVVKTPADRRQDRPLSSFGDKGVFVRSIERALLANQIDMAVHSLKDVPVDEETPGLILAAFSPREDPRDVVVSRQGQNLRDLPPGSRIGTSSPRRRMHLRTERPDLELLDIRGNVDTRLRKLQEGEFDAIVLAAAGLIRLGLSHVVSEYLSVERFVPDAGQGIIVLQTRAEDLVEPLVTSIDDRDAHVAALAERAVVRALEAGCSSPVGAHATVAGDQLTLRAMGSTEASAGPVSVSAQGLASQALEVGARVGMRLRTLLEQDGVDSEPILGRE